MTNSTHKVEVVPVRLERHPNADRLSVVKVFGYQVCSGTAEWQARPPAREEGGEKVWLGAYVPPDSTVPVSRPEFSFLAEKAKPDGRARIKAMKLRGVVSFGLLVPAPDGSVEGDDVASLLGVEHYEPPVPGEGGRKGVYMGGEAASAPNVYHVKYDVDAFRRYHGLFQPGEEVVITEKLDGASSKYVWHDGRMHVGSRTEWKKEFPDYSHLTIDYLTKQGLLKEAAQEILDRLAGKPKVRNLWWDVLSRTPSLEKFCRDHPDVVVYGEVFGSVNCIKYGLPANQFAVFDLMHDGLWLNAQEARIITDDYPDLPWVPCLDAAGRAEHKFVTVPYDFDLVCRLAEGDTLVSGAGKGVIREGVVVKPVRERQDPKVGRVCFKTVSAAYLERYR